MADGKVLPYLDVLLQHASYDVLKRTAGRRRKKRRSSASHAWRERFVLESGQSARGSIFIVGFSGETDEDFARLPNWLTEAQLDRVGCFPLRASRWCGIKRSRGRCA